MTGITRAQFGVAATFLVAFVSTARVAMTPVRAAQDELPDGAGKELTARVCGDCHGLSNLTANNDSRRGWKIVVEDMIGRGAAVSPAQSEQVIVYLSTALGRVVNVNDAGVGVFSDALDIPTAKAQQIVDYRTKNGKFKTVDDLLKIPEIDADRVKEQSPNFVFE